MYPSCQFINMDTNMADVLNQPGILKMSRQGPQNAKIDAPRDHQKLRQNPTVIELF